MEEKIFKGNGEAFSAKWEAEAYLTQNGYSYGSSSVDGPIGVAKGGGETFLSQNGGT